MLNGFDRYEAHAEGYKWWNEVWQVGGYRSAVTSKYCRFTLIRNAAEWLLEDLSIQEMYNPMMSQCLISHIYMVHDHFPKRFIVSRTMKIHKEQAIMHNAQREMS